MSDGIIFDRGYRTYDGPRRGPAGARRAVYKEGLKRIFGIGRKARAKIFPWTMMGIALITAIVIVGAHFAIGNIAEALAQGLPSYGELFDAYSWISLIFIAYAGPQLLIPDRSSGVLSVYFSRPLTVDGYLGAKTLAFATVVGAIYLVPQIVLHLGLGLISSDGFLTYMGDHLDVLWKVPATALGFIVMHGALVFFFSSIIKRPGIASSALLGTVVAGNGIARQIALADFPGARWISLVAPDQHPRIIRDHLFGRSGGFPAELAGFDVWASVISIVVVVAAAAWFVRAKYRRLA
jgi:ABC-2 type transport system permease protein